MEASRLHDVRVASAASIHYLSMSMRTNARVGVLDADMYIYLCVENIAKDLQRIVLDVAIAHLVRSDKT